MQQNFQEGVTHLRETYCFQGRYDLFWMFGGSCRWTSFFAGAQGVLHTLTFLRKLSFNF